MHNYAIPIANPLTFDVSLCKVNSRHGVINYLSDRIVALRMRLVRGSEQ